MSLQHFKGYLNEIFIAYDVGTESVLNKICEFDYKFMKCSVRPRQGQFSLLCINIIKIHLAVILEDIHCSFHDISTPVQSTVNVERTFSLNEAILCNDIPMNIKFSSGNCFKSVVTKIISTFI